MELYIYIYSVIHLYGFKSESFLSQKAKKKFLLIHYFTYYSFFYLLFFLILVSMKFPLKSGREFDEIIL